MERVSAISSRIPCAETFLIKQSMVELPLLKMILARSRLFRRSDLRVSGMSVLEDERASAS
jgi:hypothetical protein